MEAPSQMLENWCWEPSMLQQLSSHFQRTGPDGLGEKISIEACELLVQTRNVNAGLLNLRQIFFACYDLSLHSQSSSSVETTQLWMDFKKNISLIGSVDGSHPEALFGHIMGGCRFLTHFYLSIFPHLGLWRSSKRTALLFLKSLLDVKDGDLSGVIVF